MVKMSLDLMQFIKNKPGKTEEKTESRKERSAENIKPKMEKSEKVHKSKKKRGC